MEPSLPELLMPDSTRRFTVDEYHRLIDDGFFATNERVELLEGRLAEKAVQTPLHSAVVNILMKILFRMIDQRWHVCARSVVTLETSEPEPDLTVVRGTIEDYLRRHPGAADTCLLVEVADVELAIDRIDKLRIYAHAGVPTYWIVNLIDRQIEVYDRPSGPAANPGYAGRLTYAAGDAVPVVLGGVPVGEIAVSAVLPAA